MVTNSTVDGILAAFFAILIIIVILDATRICIKAIRSREPLPSTEVPAEESQLHAPAGLFARAERARAGGPRMTVAQVFSGVRWYLREVSGESAYDRYVEHRRREHPGRAGDVAARLRAPPPGRARGPAAGSLLLKLGRRRRSSAIERERWRELGGGGSRRWATTSSPG